MRAVWALGLLAASALAAHAHDNNWAVLVGTSRYWFNYRHASNTLAVYQAVKAAGIPDSNIILMLPDDVACNGRNCFQGQVFQDSIRSNSIYPPDVEIDYRGEEVTVENFLRVLTNRLEPTVSRSKRLLTNSRSNILVYLTGHGGENFLKFQDKEEITNQDFADAFQQMHAQQRYNSILFMVDTCQGGSLLTRLYSPNILGISSSRTGESSYSHKFDGDIGVYMSDKFTYNMLKYFESHRTKKGDPSLKEFISYFPYQMLSSNLDHRSDLAQRPLENITISEFFAGVSSLKILDISKSYSFQLHDTRPSVGFQNNLELHSQDSSTRAIAKYPLTRPVSSELVLAFAFVLTLLLLLWK